MSDFSAKKRKHSKHLSTSSSSPDSDQEEAVKKPEKKKMAEAGKKPNSISPDAKLRLRIRDYLNKNRELVSPIFFSFLGFYFNVLHFLGSDRPAKNGAIFV